MNTHFPTPFHGLMLSLTLCLSLGEPVSAQEPNETVTTQKDSPAKAVSDGDTKPPRRFIKIIGNTKLDVRQWPLIGNPDAKYVFVEMFDYTCPHCRDMHHEINTTLKKFGKDLAVITMQVPLSMSCNNQVGSTEAAHRDACQLANFAISVWRLEPKKYHAYHDWLFKPTHARTAAAARQRAVEIVGEQRLQKLLSKRVPQNFIASHVKLYAKAGAGSIPKMLFPNITLVGNVGSTKLCETIKHQLGNH